MKCLYCQKELENPKARFCNDKERMRFKRGIKPEQENKKPEHNPNKSEQITRTEETITRTKPEQKVVKPEQGENPNKIKKLIFTKDMPMEKRRKLYHEMYPESTWIPNWVEHGFLSQEEAIAYAIKKVKENPATHNLGLGND